MQVRQQWHQWSVALAVAGLAMGLVSLGGCAVGVSADAGVSVTPTTWETRRDHHDDRPYADPYMTSSGRAETEAKQAERPH